MILFRFERLLGHKEGEVRVLHASLFDVVIEPALDDLPDFKCPGTQDVTACTLQQSDCYLSVAHKQMLTDTGSD